MKSVLITLCMIAGGLWLFPTGAPPAAQTMVLVPAASIQMVATASPALLTRDITPDSPPPRT